MIEMAAVTERHRGSYSCVAKNRAGTVNQTAVLTVNGMRPPWRIKNNDDLRFGAGLETTTHRRH